jgi:GTPase SAR1 family protein
VHPSLDFFLYFQEVAEKRIPIMMCGNKTDMREAQLKEGRTCVTTEQGEKLARDHSAIFLETSSKSGQNVIDAIVNLSR